MSRARAYYAPKDHNETSEYQSSRPQKKEKKGLFRRRAVALLIAAIVVLGSTYSGVERSIDDRCWETQTIYYGGVYSEDTNSYEPALYDQLEVRYDSALGILTAVRGYEELKKECDEFEKAADQLYGAYTSHAKCYTNDQLQLSYEALVSAVDDAKLSERDMKLFETYSSDFLGSQRMIEQAAPKYNESVRQLHKELDNFPANILVQLTDVDVPQYYE